MFIELRTDIGLLLFTDDGSPLLNTGVILAVFKLSGYTPAVIERLKILVSAGINKGADTLINFV